jgi:hypothetical protein
MTQSTCGAKRRSKAGVGVRAAGLVGAHGSAVARSSFAQCSSHALGPVHGSDGKHHHARPAQHPCLAGFGCIFLHSRSCGGMHGGKHCSLHLQQPPLHRPACSHCVHRLHQRHLLALHRLHVRDGERVRERQAVHCLEALFQMRLDPCGILGLGQDLQHLIIGQIEKPAQSTQCFNALASIACCTRGPVLWPSRTSIGNLPSHRAS